MLPLPYIIVYGVDPEFVHIFRVVHGAKETTGEPENTP